MIAQLRYNVKIVAPTLLWTGILVSVLIAMVLFFNFRNPRGFTAVTAGNIAEHLIPIIAAFFSAGVLDAEMKRGAHELLRSKQRPLWHTVGYRLLVSVLISVALGAAVLAAVHFGIRRVPFGMLILAAIPSAFCLALISLWTRIRLGNVFVGYMVALVAWLANWVVALLSAGGLGLTINPLLTLTSYTDRLSAVGRGAVETTPYVDWWWVSKLALLVLSAGIFISITRRVENLVEGD